MYFMMILQEVLHSWGRPEFDTKMKARIDAMTVEQLPLQQAITSSSYALDSSIKSIIINKSDDVASIIIKAGVYFTGIIAGCNCADDPSPADEIPEYCVVLVEIDKATAETTIMLLDE